MSRALMIVPWAGGLPDWIVSYMLNIERLKPYGYDWLFITDLADLSHRIEDQLGVPAKLSPGRLQTFRPMFGVLYADKIDGYDFWGHTDLDCLYGRVWKWLTPEFLDGIDIYGNHYDYVSGPWSLYRNHESVNSLFARRLDWRDLVAAATDGAWVEREFTETANAHANVRYEYLQTRNLNRFDDLWWDDDRLMEGDTEVFMAHFRRLKPKVYPPQCRL